MPGLSVVYDQDRTHEREQLAALAQGMAGLLAHFEWYHRDAYADSEVAFRRVSLGLANPGPQPVHNQDGSLLAMVYGELYDTERARRKLSPLGHQFQREDDAELVVHLYEERGFGFVKELNGSFVILIYDKLNKKLIVCNDRYGTRPLYWYRHNGLLLLASEVKSLLAYDGLTPELNFPGLVDLVAAGYLLHNKTLLRGVEMLPAGTILVAEGEALRVENYWSWYDIPRQSPSYEDAVVTMGELWMQAVQRCCSGSLRLGCTISGGLDSRAVLSAVVKAGFPVTAWTFGSPLCADIEIARRVCEVLDVEHYSWFTSAARWRQIIDLGVWLSDGQQNAIHNHGVASFLAMKEHCDVRLTGILGEIPSGKYMLRDGEGFGSLAELEQYLLKDYFSGAGGLSNVFTDPWAGNAVAVWHQNVKESVQELIQDPERPGFYVVNNRWRRFINTGSVNVLAIMIDRKPFADNDFVDFVYGLPNSWRFNARIYTDMLLDLFPRTYRTIPWQQTGVPIAAPRYRELARRLVDRGKRVINSGCGRVGLPPPFGPRSFADYGSWMRDDPALRRYVLETVLSDRALGRAYFHSGFVQRVVRSHLNSQGDYSSIIGIFLTVEIFCRQFLDRETPDCAAVHPRSLESHGCGGPKS